MSRLLGAVARLFVEPEVADAPRSQQRRPGCEPPGVRWLPPEPAAAAPSRRQPRARAHVALVCAPRDLRVAAGAVGLAVLQARSARSAVVLEWSGAGAAQAASERAPSPAARRCAAALQADGVEAHACGRLVRSVLDADADTGAAAQAAALLPTLDEPAVVAIAGPRGPRLDELLAAAATIVLAHRSDADPELVAVAVAGLERLGPPVRTLVLGGSPGAAALARSGHALVSPLRAAALAALGAG